MAKVLHQFDSQLALHVGRPSTFHRSVEPKQNVVLEPQVMIQQWNFQVFSLLNWNLLRISIETNPKIRF